MLESRSQVGLKDLSLLSYREQEQISAYLGGELFVFLSECRELDLVVLIFFLKSSLLSPVSFDGPTTDARVEARKSSVGPLLGGDGL